ncbi:hypothetical protein HBI64_015640 [Parastagonospora nodorum]|nr:hypothetical protein HBI64_015640 [Parastagonospora nodorum]
MPLRHQRAPTALIGKSTDRVPNKPILDEAIPPPSSPTPRYPSSRADTQQVVYGISGRAQRPLTHADNVASREATWQANTHTTSLRQVQRAPANTRTPSVFATGVWYDLPDLPATSRVTAHSLVSFLSDSLEHRLFLSSDVTSVVRAVTQLYDPPTQEDLAQRRRPSDELSPELGYPYRWSFAVDKSAAKAALRNTVQQFLADTEPLTSHWLTTEDEKRIRLATDPLPAPLPAVSTLSDLILQESFPLSRKPHANQNQPRRRLTFAKVHWSKPVSV